MRRQLDRRGVDGRLVAAAAGSEQGSLAVADDADVVLVDACRGGSQSDALSALRNGDIPGVGAVVTAGVPRFVGRSRNTPETVKRVQVVRSNVVQDFSGAAH